MKIYEMLTIDLLKENGNYAIHNAKRRRMFVLNGETFDEEFNKQVESLGKIINIEAEQPTEYVGLTYGPIFGIFTERVRASVMHYRRGWRDVDEIQIIEVFEKQD